MKGTEHFRKAEEYLRNGADQDGYGSQTEQYFISAAQVHATLAAATAVSNLVTVWGDIAKMMRADSELADAEPPRAEPLVTCNAAPADDGPERCHLAIGHDGLHEHVYGSRAVHWSTAEELRTITPQYPDVSGGGVPYPPRTNACAAPGHEAGSWCTLTYDHPHMHEDKQGRKWGVVPVEPALLYESTATDLHMEMPR